MARETGKKLFWYNNAVWETVLVDGGMPGTCKVCDRVLGDIPSYVSNNDQFAVHVTCERKNVIPTISPDVEPSRQENRPSGSRSTGDFDTRIIPMLNDLLHSSHPDEEVKGALKKLSEALINYYFNSIN